MKKTMRSLLIVFGILAGIFLLIQFVPYGKDQTNPAVVSEPNWDSAATRSLAQRACFDCHSHETVYPWYSKIAPASWLLAKDIQEGRQNLNFSDWGGARQPSAAEISEVIQEGEMPPFYYVWMHPIADLSAAEKQTLIDGLNNSLK